MFPDAKKPNHVHEQYYVSLNDKTPFLSFFLFGGRQNTFSNTLQK